MRLTLLAINLLTATWAATPSFADEMLRPANYGAYPQRWDQRYVFVPDARLAYVDYAALRRDIPDLKSKSNEDIDHWILRNFSYVSQNQLRLRGVRSNEFAVDETNARTFIQPRGYNRASVEKDQDFGVLVDVKGSGHASEAVQKNFAPGYEEQIVETQVRHFKEIMAGPELGRQEKLDALRTLDHSDGLMTLGEAIAETTRQKAVQRAFDHYNSKRGTSYQTVESYFIIALPARILKKGSESVPAALYGRQPHFGRHSGADIPEGIYRDDFGGRQQSSLTSSVDYGGVMLTEPHLVERFGPPSETLNENYVPDAQRSRAWRFGHETAAAFDREHDRGIVERHIDWMLGSLPEVAEKESRELAKARYLAHRFSRLGNPAKLYQEFADLLETSHDRDGVIRTLAKTHAPILNLVDILNRGGLFKAYEIAHLQNVAALGFLDANDIESADLILRRLPEHVSENFDEVARRLVAAGQTFPRFEVLSSAAQVSILETLIHEGRASDLLFMGQSLGRGRKLRAEVLEVLFKASSGKRVTLSNAACTLLDRFSLDDERRITGEISDEALKIAQRANSQTVRAFANKTLVARHRARQCGAIFGDGSP